MERPRGKPPESFDSRIDRIVEATDGMDFEQMAARIGVNRSTLYRLRRTDKLPEGYDARVALESMARKAKVKL